MHAVALVVRQVHPVGRLPPVVDLLLAKSGVAHQRPESLRILLRQRPDGLHGVPEVLARHQVRVQVVVDDGVVLVRPGHPVDPELAVVAAEEAEVDPQARGLDQDLRADLLEEFPVTGDVHILAKRVHDVRVDVVLRRPRRVIRGGLVAVDGAPGEERAALVDLPRACARLGQEGMPLTKQVLRDPRLGVREERQHVDLGVPEIVPLVTGPRQALGRHAHALGARRRLAHLKQVEPDRLLPLRVVAHFPRRCRFQKSSRKRFWLSSRSWNPFSTARSRTRSARWHSSSTWRRRDEW